MSSAPVGPEDGGLEEGVVVRVDRRQCDVQLADVVVPCSLRGHLFENEKEDLETRPVAVGDRVRVTREGERGAVEEVLPRRTTLQRTSSQRGKVQVLAANVDLVLVVVSLRRPRLRPTLIDRLLVVAESAGLDVLLIVNKIDLCQPGEVEAFLEPYRSLGYTSVAISATEGVNLDAVRTEMAGRVSVVLGHSGVGKSSLLNALDPTLELRVGEVTRRDGKGRHTTTFSQSIRVGADATVVDGPGIREYGLARIEIAELAHGFIEMRPHLPHCRFSTCTHTHEPSCRVKQALEEGAILPARYATYCKLLEELQGGGERMPRHGSY